MARSSGQKGGHASRIRFIMLDAELQDSDLGEVTRAIQNALQHGDGAIGGHRHLHGAVRQIGAGAPTDMADHVAEQIEKPLVQEESAEPRSRPRGIRKVRAPKVIDLDLTSEPSFKSYAQAKSPTSDAMRFLVVAAWFKHHRDLEAISVDHVYTCYRAVGWPSGIGDFGSPFRHLKHTQLVEQKDKGMYSINHIGIAKVDKLGETNNSNES